MAKLPIYIGRVRRAIGSYIDVPDDIFVELSKFNWYRNTNGYVRNSLSGLYLHQMAYRIYHGQLPENTEIDHKDRNKDNVTKDNLRAVTRSVNGANKGKSKLNQSGRTGVSYRVSKYTRNGKTYEYQYWNARVKKDKKLVLCKDFPYTTDGLIQAAREVNRQYAIHFPEVAAPNVGVEINDN